MFFMQGSKMTSKIINNETKKFIYRIEAVCNGITYHLNKTWTRGGTGNSIALVNLNENYT